MAEVFKTISEYGTEPVILHSSKVKNPLIQLQVPKLFKVKGKKRLVALYRLKMAVKRMFKDGKLEMVTENLMWRGAAKVRMHVVICYTCILVVVLVVCKIGMPELTNSIVIFTKRAENKLMLLMRAVKKFHHCISEMFSCTFLFTNA